MNTQQTIAVAPKTRAPRPKTVVRKLRTVEVQRNWGSGRPDTCYYDIPLRTAESRIEAVACAVAESLITDDDLSSTELYHTPEVDDDQPAADELARGIKKIVRGSAEIEMLYTLETVDLTVIWLAAGDHAEAEAAIRALNAEYGYELTFSTKEQPAPVEAA